MKSLMVKQQKVKTILCNQSNHHNGLSLKRQTPPTPYPLPGTYFLNHPNQRRSRNYQGDGYIYMFIKYKRCCTAFYCLYGNWISFPNKVLQYSNKQSSSQVCVNWKYVKSRQWLAKNPKAQECVHQRLIFAEQRLRNKWKLSRSLSFKKSYASEGY